MTIPPWLKINKDVDGTKPSVSTWLKIGKYGTKQLVEREPFWELGVDATGHLFWKSRSTRAGTRITCPKKLPLNEWVHITITSDKYSDVYVNGERAFSEIDDVADKYFFGKYVPSSEEERDDLEEHVAKDIMEN